MAEGRFDEAAALYSSMLKAVPNNSGLLLNLGLAEEMGGHPDRAVTHLQGVLKTNPGSIPALTSLAMAHLQLNQPAEAIAPLKKVLAANRKDVNATGMLAGAQLALGHADEAAETYTQLTTLTPTDPKAWYGLGKSYESLANRSFAQLAKLDEQSAYVAAILAEARLQQHQYRSAFFFYREAQKKMPNLPGVHIGLARVYAATGHPDWSAAEQSREAATPCGAPEGPACQFLSGKFRNAAAAQPQDAAHLFWNTRAYNAAAITAFDRLGTLPESVEQHALKAQVQHDHGQDAQAAEEWKAALRVAPDRNDPRLKTELAASLFQAQDYTAAIPALRELLVSQPQSPDLNFMLGESLWRSQQPEQAVPYLQASLKQSPDLLPAHAALGLTLVALSKHADAIPHLEKAVSLDDDGSLHYSLARAYQAVGNQEQAKANMEAYTKMQRQNADLNGAVAEKSEITAPQ